MENYRVYYEDITEEDYNWIISTAEVIAVDTETTGLDPIINELCLIQIKANNRFFLIKFDKNNRYVNLTKLLVNEDIKKVFHQAIFDVRFLMNNLNIKNINNIICTKISAKLLNGIREKNSLKNLIEKYLDIKISKDQQTSNWKQELLTPEQLEYACKDVEHLVELWSMLEKKLIENQLIDYAKSCFQFISTQAYLNNNGINNIYEY
jgi:ribonuclease D